MIRPICSLVVVALLALVGCRPSTPPSAGSAAPPAVSVGPPVTEAEAWAFGDQVTVAMKAKNVAALAKLLRLDDLIERSVSDYGMTADELKGFRDGLAKSGGGQKVLSFWAEQLGGDSTRRLRVGSRDGRTTILTRMAGDGGLNYLEFTLIRTADGAVAAEDIYTLANGEKLSQVLRRLTYPMLTALRKGDKSAAGKAQLDRMERMSKLSQAMRAGQMDETARLYRGLPADMKDEKAFMLVGLQALAQTDDAGYLAELERYRKLFPNDPSVDLMSVDYHFLKKDVPELKACLRRIEQAVGADPYLWVLEANLLTTTGQPAEAKKLAEKAIQDEPTLAEAYWSVATAALATDDHQETARVLRQIVEKFDTTDPDGVAATPEYARFVKSPEFAAFRKWYADRPKE